MTTQKTIKPNAARTPLDGGRELPCRTTVAQNGTTVHEYFADNAATVILREHVDTKTGITRVQAEQNRSGHDEGLFRAFYPHATPDYPDGVPYIVATKAANNEFTGDYRQYYADGKPQFHATADGKGGFIGVVRQWRTDGTQYPDTVLDAKGVAHPCDDCPATQAFADNDDRTHVYHTAPGARFSLRIT